MIEWRKSSFSAGGGDCVEVGWADLRVAVRDSKSTGPSINFPVDGWRGLMANLQG
jgi:Domain of unknown function (DUF397)